jgi:hypothetical protein
MAVECPFRAAVVNTSDLFVQPPLAILGAEDQMGEKLGQRLS